MQDLRDEFECYFNIKNIIKIIDKIELTSDSHANIKLLYESLSEEGIISSKELDLLDAWLIDFMNISGHRKKMTNSPTVSVITWDGGFRENYHTGRFFL